MPDEREIREAPDQSKDSSAKSDVLSTEESKRVQEEAAGNSADRKRFLEGSLGKGRSPSTEVLKEMVVSILDGAKQLVGNSSDSQAADNGAPPIESAVAGLAKNELSLAHPVDSIVEIYHRIVGDGSTAPPASDTPATPGEKPAEGSKSEESPEDLLKKIKEDPQAKAEHEHLEKVAGEKIKNPEELKRFKEDMEALEKRASEQKPPLSPEELKNTYKEISKLMEAKDSPDSPLKEADRVRLAEQVIHQAAFPTDISQGDYNTCNVTVGEVRTYTKNPSEAARLVTEVATTGKYHTSGKPPLEITIDRDSMLPHGESKTHPPGDNQRSYASQIFDVTAVNIHYAREHARGGPDIRYEQHEPKPGGPNEKPPADNGERLMSYADKNKPVEVTYPDGTPKRSPGLKAFDYVEAAKEISPEPKVKLADGREVEAPIGIQRYPADSPDKEPKNLAGVVFIDNEADFEKTIAQMKAEGRLPVMVGVHTGREPFRSDSGEHQAGERGGAHVVLVTDYEPGNPPKVSVDNQWGESADHRKDHPGGDQSIPLHNLFQATQESPTMKDLTALEKQHDRGEFKGKEDEYNKQLEKMYVESIKRWDKEKADGTLDKNEQTMAVQEFQDYLKSLQPSPQRGREILKHAIETYKKEKGN